MNIINIPFIISAVILIGILFFPAVAMLIGLLRRPNKNHAAICITVLSGVIAFVIALLLKNAMISSATGGFIAGIITKMGYAELVTKAPAAVEYIAAIVVSAIVPFVFAVLFVVIKGIGLCFNPLAAKLFKKNAPAGKSRFLAGMGIGLLNGALISLLIFFPLCATISMADKAVSSEDFAQISELFEDAPGEIKGYTSVLADNVGVKAVNSCGGKLLYAALSQVGTGKDTLSLEEQIAQLEGITSAGMQIINANGGKLTPEAADAIKDIAEKISGNEQLKAALADVLSAAGESWSNGEEFIGIEKPKSEDGSESLIAGLTEVLKNTTSDTLGNNLDALVKALDAMQNSGALEELSKDDADLLDALSKKGAVSGVLDAVSENENLQPIVDGMTGMMIDKLSQSLEIDQENKERLEKALNIDISSLNEEETQRLENIIINVNKVKKSISSGDDEKTPEGEGKNQNTLEVLRNIDSEALKELLNDVDDSKFIDKNELIDAIGSSKKSDANSVFNDSTIDMLKNNDAEKISLAFEILKKAAEIIDIVNNKERSGQSYQLLSDDIEWITANIDEDSEKMLENQLTKENLKNFGVPEKNVSGVKSLISNVLCEMLAAKSADGNAEGYALTNLYDTAVNTDLTSSGRIYSDGKAKTLVKSVLQSEIMRQAVISTAYDANGNLITDPIGTGAKYSEADRKDITDAMNMFLEDYASLSSEEKASRETSLVALSSLIGVKATVENGVYIIK